MRQRSFFLTSLYSRQAGFTILELVLVMAAALTLAAIIAPGFSFLRDANRANVAARAVERDLESARLKAVSSSRSIRVRLNCPAPGQLRVLEVTGIATTDDATNRCDPVAFPYPGPRDALRSTPSLDGPVTYLPDGATVTGAVQYFQFDPRGTTYSVDGAGVATVLAGEVILTISYKTRSHTVRINAVGRITFE